MSICKILYKNFVKVSSILTTTKRKPYITINICKLHILYNLLKPIFKEIKSDFTDFRCCTSSLGRLQNFCFHRVLCLRKNALHVTTEPTPNVQETKL